MKKETQGKLILGAIILILIFLMGTYYGLFSSKKPSVLVHLAPNITEIKGFVYARYPETMQCVACEYFFAEVRVYYQEVLICQSKEGTINLGEVILPIRCNEDLENYEGREVTVEANGSVTPSGSKPIVSYDKQILNLTFINKK